MYKKFAFTLAEVLITLGIIGVVAAMTLPTLIQNYRKHEVETKLAKVYSVVNQAIKLSTVEYGEPAEWGDWDCGISSAATCTIDEAIEKFNKYIGKNLQILKIEKIDDSHFNVYLNDGEILGFRNFLYDINLYLNQKAVENSIMGVNTFRFRFSPKLTTGFSPINESYYVSAIKPTFEPYTWSWDGTNEELTANTRGCSNNGTKLFCTKLIQLNGWKIPKDYPLKF